MIKIAALKIVSVRELSGTLLAILAGAIAELAGIGIVVGLGIKAVKDGGLWFQLFSTEVIFTQIECLILGLLVFGCRSLLVFYAGYRQTKFSFVVHEKISSKIYGRIVNDVTYTLDADTSAIVQETITELHNYRDMFLVPLMSVVSELMICTVLFIILMWFSPVATFFIVIFGIMLIGISKVFNKNLKFIGKERKVLEKQRLDLVRNTKEGCVDLFVYKQRERYTGKFLALTELCASVAVRHANGINALRAIQEMILVTMIMLIVGTIGNATASAIVLFMLIRLVPSSTRISTGLQSILFTKAINDDVNRLLQEDNEDILVNNNAGSGYAINVHDKTIHYTEVPSVDRIGMMCITGKSGAGKSQLILGLVGARDIIGPNGNKLKPISGNVGYVPQHDFMEDGSVEDNIAFGRPLDQLRMSVIARDVNLNFIKDPIYNGVIFDGRLSGGQRKRLSIARALYSGAEYIFLDEPTNGLDAASVSVILATLKRLKDHVSIVCVSHDDRVINVADKIFKIETTIHNHT